MLTLTIGQESLGRALERASEGMRAKMRARLSQAAQAAFERAQSSEGYRDVTGNLRSSAQAAVFQDGEAVESFQALTKDGREGLRRGKEELERLAAGSGRDPEMAVVAAMPYAAEVESRGKDVLSGAFLQAERLAKGG